MTSHTKTTLITISHITALVAAIILLQTLYFKFTGHPESVMIFSMLHAEPWGRILAGIVELVLGVTILIPRTRFIGSVGVCALMLGAIGSHILVLGTHGMHMSLFNLAVIAFICADITGAITFYLKRHH